MRKAALWVLLNCCCLFGLAQTGYWQQQADYKIAAVLDETRRELTATIQIEYYNRSPDTLHFVWLHLWANAYKNDRTALIDQLLEQGSTQFYFSNDEQRGYINRLSCKVNGTIAIMVDHPQHQDIIKVLLPDPLPPGGHCSIASPFHVKLPENISRGGFAGNSFQITQWYPKLSVYDRKGWHPMPYLDQGEFYSDFGNYDVSIDVPATYTVAATGQLQDSVLQPGKARKLLRYRQEQVIDFAWFADKQFQLQQDTVALPSGKIIDLYAYSLPGKNSTIWKNSIRYMKQTLLTRSSWLGEYPYQTASVVEAPLQYPGGMEYPTIAVLSGVRNEQELEGLIEHELGHNWFYAILASNERDHPWMDEGMNSYYDGRYRTLYPAPVVATKKKQDFVSKRVPEDNASFLLRVAASEHKDQPIETASEEFTQANYGLSAYYKASTFLRYLEAKLGTELFDRCMRAYFARWQFKHPYPSDFRQVLTEVSGQSMDSAFALLQQHGVIPLPVNSFLQSGAIDVPARSLKFSTFFNFRQTDRYKYLFVAPILGYNLYDKLMPGLAIHNFTLPAEHFQFLAVPMYGTGSKKLNGVAALQYHWFPKQSLYKVEAGINGAHFSSNHRQDSTGKTVFEHYTRVVPFIRVHFKHAARSTFSSYLDLRSIVIAERLYDVFEYLPGNDSIAYPVSFANQTRSIHQLSFHAQDSRVLYPYNYQLQLQASGSFYRLNATGNYFFNYPKGGGMEVRLFVAKFGYLGNDRTAANQYVPKLLAGNGADDYTNSNYFIGRTASTQFADLPINNKGLPAQQVMIQNTGGLKLRLDQYGSVQGYSENWVAAANFSTTLPDRFMSIFPVKLPLRLFFDVGSYAEAWSNKASTGRFLYTGGIQLSLMKNVVNIYLPLMYNKVFKEQTDLQQLNFLKRVTFSIDFQQITLKKLLPSLPL